MPRSPTLVVTLMLLAVSGAAAAQPTACDLLAAHPEDPDKITAGIATSVVKQDLATAIAACRADVARYPEVPRLTYYLGRVLFYDRQFEAGLAVIEKAAAQGHRQSQFVAGLIYSRGSGGHQVEPCRAARQWLDAGRRGHYAATLTIAQRYLAGTLTDCALDTDAAELRTLVEAARSHEMAGNYYHRVLLDTLTAGLEAAE